MDTPDVKSPRRVSFQKRIKSRFFSVFYCGTSCCWKEAELIAFFINDAGPVNIEFVNSPKQADVLFIAGLINAKREEIIRNLYDQIPNPKYVIATGTCALSKGLYQSSYVKSSLVQEVVPVDVFVAGCPPTLENILKGFNLLSEKIKQA